VPDTFENLRRQHERGGGQRDGLDSRVTGNFLKLEFLGETDKARPSAKPGEPLQQGEHRQAAKKNFSLPTQASFRLRIPSSPRWMLIPRVNLPLASGCPKPRHHRRPIRGTPYYPFFFRAHRNVNIPGWGHGDVNRPRGGGQNPFKGPPIPPPRPPLSATNGQGPRTTGPAAKVEVGNRKLALVY